MGNLDRVVVFRLFDMGEIKEQVEVVLPLPIARSLMSDMENSTAYQELPDADGRMCGHGLVVDIKRGPEKPQRLRR